MKRIRAHSMISAVMLLLACSSLAANETLNLQSTELLEAFSSRLGKSGIWYKVTGSKALEVKPEDYQAALKLLFETAEEFLPDGRAVAYEAEECQSTFRARLEEEDIPYQVRMHDGLEWVIWEHKDAKQVEAILKDVSLGLCQ